MKNTLLLDNNPNTGLFHTLLFTLAGHKVAEVRSPTDALARLLSGNGSFGPFHLLVVSNYSGSIPFETFVETLRDAGSRVPVIIFDRPGNPPESRLPGVVWCSSDDALETVSTKGVRDTPLPPPLPKRCGGDIHIPLPSP